MARTTTNTATITQVDHAKTITQVDQAKTITGDFTLALPWTPAEITTEAWWDANDATTITESGGSVSQWDDRSGNGNNLTQGSGSSQPTTGTRTIGGLNAFDFDGGDTLNGGVLGLANYSKFCVVSFDVAAGNNILSYVTGNNDALWTAGGLTPRVYHSGPQLIGSAVSASNPLLLGATYDAVTIELFQNATSEGTLANSMGASTSSIVMGAFGGGNRINGLIAEVIVLDRASDTDERQKIEGYLAHKWGLEDDLPVGHPYKTSRPTI